MSGESEATVRGAAEREGIRDLLADRTLVVVLCLSFVGGVGGAASPALPGIASAFGVSDARVGLVMTAYSLGSVLVLPLSGALLDAYGRRPVVLSLLALFGAAGTAIAFVRTFELVLLLRFLQGAGFAGTIPLSIALVGDLYSGPSGSSAQGLQIGATGLSRVLIPGVAGFLAGFAWHYPFLLNLLGIAAFGLAYRYLPETGEVDAADPGGRQRPGELRSRLRSARAAVAAVEAELRDAPCSSCWAGCSSCSSRASP